MRHILSFLRAMASRRDEQIVCDVVKLYTVKEKEREQTHAILHKKKRGRERKRK